MKLVQIYFKNTAVISNFLAFFQFLVDKFTLLDPDPCGSGSGSTALIFIHPLLKNILAKWEKTPHKIWGDS